MAAPAPQAPSFIFRLTRLVLAAIGDFFHWPQGGKPLPETTPLHEAAKAGNIAELRRLLKEGANPNVQDAELNTPLHKALSAKATWVLLEAGADPNALNASNRAPLDFADGRQAGMLRRHGGKAGPPRVHPGIGAL